MLNWICLFMFMNFFFQSDYDKKNSDYIKSEKTMAELMTTKGKSIAKQLNLVFLNRGLGQMVDDEEARWAFSLTSKERLNLEQSKVLGRKITQELINELYQNPAYEKHLSVLRETKPYYNIGSISPNLIAFKVVFWDEDVNRRFPPDIAQIRAAGSHIYYYYADTKDQSLLPPIYEESFESAGIKIPTCIK